ncbi:uncharacterized protein LOC141900207 [Tubulanus polymorphus]|uniref:uncharacterized protein LOC141900207 n=1 Tax=Tubulanus polymorphus TaxID=672921 RepID=UPI003DA4FB9F
MPCGIKRSHNMRTDEACGVVVEDEEKKRDLNQNVHHHHVVKRPCYDMLGVHERLMDVNESDHAMDIEYDNSAENVHLNCTSNSSLQTVTPSHNQALLNTPAEIDSRQCPRCLAGESGHITHITR